MSNCKHGVKWTVITSYLRQNVSYEQFKGLMSLHCISVIYVQSVSGVYWKVSVCMVLRHLTHNGV